MKVVRQLLLAVALPVGFSAHMLFAATLPLTDSAVSLVMPKVSIGDVTVFSGADDWIPSWRSVSHNACGKICTADWAMQKFAEAGVLPPEVAAEAAKRFANPQAFPKAEKFWVRKGDIVATTSVTDGKPQMFTRIKATFEDPALGYGWTLTDKNGRQFEVFRVVECGNYTSRPAHDNPLVSELSGGGGSAYENSGPFIPAAYTPFVSGGGQSSGSGGGSGGNNGGSSSGGGTSGGCLYDCGNPPVITPPIITPPIVPPAPVSLPAGLGLLLIALFSLRAISRPH